MNVLEFKYLTSSQGRKKKGFFDVLIDGKSLYDRLDLYDTENVCVFGYFQNNDINISFVNQFLKIAESNLETKRYELFVCRECGDIGCGSVTLNIEKKHASYLWKSFAFENDSFNLEDEDFFELSQFEFSKNEYEKVLSKLKEDLLKLEEIRNPKINWKSFWKSHTPLSL